MINGTLRHRFDDDGVLIIAGSLMARVTEAEAKRFAWSILADLEPEDDDVVARTSEEFGESQKVQVLARLIAGDATYVEVAKHIGRTKEYASVLLSQFFKRGLIEKCGGSGKRGCPFRWRIADGGRTYLDVVGYLKAAAE